MDDLIKRKGQFLTRFLHSLLASIILVSIIVIYFSVFTNEINGLTHLSVAVVVFEAAILFIFKGDCPFVFLHQLFGDERSFFNLFMPEKFVTPVILGIGLVALGGIVLLVF